MLISTRAGWSRSISRLCRVGYLVGAAALSLVLLSSNFSAPAMAQSGTVIYVMPPTQVSSPGATVGVDIRIDSAANLYGAEIHLSFDPTLLAVQDANLIQAGTQIGLGPLLTSGGAGTYNVGANAADNGAGTIDIAITLINPTAPVSGSGVFAHVDFTALTSGVGSVQITSAILADRNANRQPFSSQTGQIVVVGTSIGSQNGTAGTSSAPAEVPEADTLFLLGSGGAGLIGFLLLKWRTRGSS